MSLNLESYKITKINSLLWPVLCILLNKIIILIEWINSRGSMSLLAHCVQLRILPPATAWPGEQV